MPETYIKLAALDPRGANAPKIAHLKEISEMPNGSATCVNIPVGRGLALQGLVLVKERGLPLIAQFHGALDKEKYAPPRYERLATLRDIDANTILFADPTIMLDPKLQLAWYTGWAELDLHALIGCVIQELAEILAAGPIVTTGSSGGGFAALQVAPFVRDAISVPMNPQTAVHAYRIEGIHMGPQNTYRRIVMPHLGNPDNKRESREDWWVPFAHRLSAVERYRIPQNTPVKFWQNVNDSHHYKDHFQPFVAAYEQSGAGRLTCIEYEGPRAHVQPAPNIYMEGLKAAMGESAM